MCRVECTVFKYIHDDLCKIHNTYTKLVNIFNSIEQKEKTANNKDSIQFIKYILTIFA